MDNICRRRRGRARRLDNSSNGSSLAPLYLVTLCGISVNGLVSAVAPDMAAGVGAARSSGGWIIAVAALPGIAAAPAIGAAADRWGRERVASACLTLFGIAGMTSAIAPTFGWLLVARAIQGLASAGLVNLAVVMIGTRAGSNTAKALGRNAAILASAPVPMALLSGGVVEVVGWRALFLLYGLSLFVARHLGRGGGLAGSSESRRESAGSAELPPGARRRLQASVAWAVVLFIFVYGVTLTYLPAHLSTAFGIGPAWRGVLLAVPAAASTVASLASGSFVGSRGSSTAVAVSFVALGVGTVLVGSDTSLPTVLVGTVFLGAGQGIAVPALQHVVLESTGAPGGATGMAWWVSGARVGQAIGSAGSSAVLGAGTRSATLAVALLAIVTAATTRRTFAGRPPERALTTSRKTR